MTTFEPAPLDLDQVIDPEWLTLALDGLAVGDRVVDAYVLHDHTTVLSKVRFEAVIASGDGARRTRSYCVKGGFTERSRGYDLRTEARCLTELCPPLGLRVPTCVYAGFDDRIDRTIFIMDDLVAAGAVFLNSQTPFSPELTAEVLSQLARLHAHTWGAAKLRPYQWLVGTSTNPRTVPQAARQQFEVNIADGRGDGLPGYLLDPSRVWAAAELITTETRVCVAHGDPHSFNIYLDRDGRPGLLDWQITHVGHWATDVGYHIAVALDIEARRAHEKDLLRGYLAELGRLGVEAPSWEQAWDDYTSHILYGHFLWNMATSTPRVDIIEHVPRLGTALVDHGTYARLGI